MILRINPLTSSSDVSAHLFGSLLAAAVGQFDSTDRLYDLLPGQRPSAVLQASHSGFERCRGGSGGLVQSSVRN